MSDQVGKQVSVYIRAGDLALWERAEQYAREHRLAMSALVMLALERFLDNDPPARQKRR